jgi:hypothetical protein
MADDLTDLVARLRDPSNALVKQGAFALVPMELMRKAADALERLARVLREAVTDHDTVRTLVKHYIDIDRDGDYMVPVKPWAMEAQQLLAKEAPHV